MLVLIPIYKNKGDVNVHSCRNNRGIKFMSHTLKLWERIVDARLREEVPICEQHNGVTLGRASSYICNICLENA